MLKNKLRDSFDQQTHLLQTFINPQIFITSGVDSKSNQWDIPIHEEYV